MSSYSKWKSRVSSTVMPSSEKWSWNARFGTLTSGLSKPPSFESREPLVRGIFIWWVPVCHVELKWNIFDSNQPYTNNKVKNLHSTRSKSPERQGIYGYTIYCFLCAGEILCVSHVFKWETKKTFEDHAGDLLIQLEFSFQKNVFSVMVYPKKHWSRALIYLNDRI